MCDSSPQTPTTSMSETKLGKDRAPPGIAAVANSVYFPNGSSNNTNGKLYTRWRPPVFSCFKNHIQAIVTSSMNLGQSSYESTSLSFGDTTL